MLNGIRVLDLTDERGHLAGRILADLGAEVIQIEPPGGDPLRRRGPFIEGAIRAAGGIPFLAANSGKRAIELDLGSSDGRARLLEWVGHSDVLIESFEPGVMAEWGLDQASLRAIRPELVHCAITPFGSTGPRARWRAHDLVVVAMGGNAALTGDPDRAPLRCGAPTSHIHAGPEAVVGILFALLARAESGRGDFVDVSMQECQLATLISAPGQYALTGKSRQRAGARIGRTREIWRTQDGWVSFGLRGGAARADGLRRLVEYMGESGYASPSLLERRWETFDVLASTADEIAALEAAFAAFFESQTTASLYAEAVRRRLLLAPCHDGRSALDDPQLRARGLFVPLSTTGTGDGSQHTTIEIPGHFAKCQEHAGPRVENLGQGHGPVEVASASGDSRPLFRDLKILELGAGAAGPVASRYFVEHGATVLRIESTQRPDFIRLLHVRGGAATLADLDRSAMFALLNSGKKSIELNLSMPEARLILERLVAWVDVLSENFTPGVLEKWGLDAKRLAELNPSLIVMSTSLFGQTGPHRDYPGFGGQGAALAGFNHLTGWPDREPVGPYATITDSLAPRFIAATLAAALLERRRTGRGRHIDVSQVEVGVYCLSEAIARASVGGNPPCRIGNRSENDAPHGVYPCAGEDRWVAIAILSDSQWRALSREMERPELGLDDRFSTAIDRVSLGSELDELVASWTRGERREDLVARLQAVGVEAGMVQDCADLLHDPQLEHRGHFQRVPHPALGDVLVERLGFRLSGRAAGFSAGGPCLGQHTHEVLRTVLGMDENEIARLERERVIA